MLDLKGAADTADDDADAAKTKSEDDELRRKMMTAS
jgi:hypothetical protein